MTRIIAGTAGSLRLDVPKSGTRPTSDRVREAIFSRLDSWGYTSGHRVLDLYAGSGALGLEAASRGAEAVTFVEKHPQAAQTIERNLQKVRERFSSGTAPEMRVQRASVQTFLEQAGNAVQYDVVMLDPPYDIANATLTANLAALKPLLAEGAVVLIERASRDGEPDWPAHLSLLQAKRYGDTQLWWAEAIEPAPQT